MIENMFLVDLTYFKQYLKKKKFPEKNTIICPYKKKMIKNNYLSCVAVIDLMKGIETTTFSRIACTGLTAIFSLL